MRVLLDECVPKGLAGHFTGHDVHTVMQMGWAGLKNGPLIARMQSEGFHVFITVDQNLPYQQNLKQARITVVIMKAFSNAVDDLQPLVPAVLRSLKIRKTGDVIGISA